MFSLVKLTNKLPKIGKEIIIDKVKMILMGLAGQKEMSHHHFQ